MYTLNALVRLDPMSLCVCVTQVYVRIATCEGEFACLKRMNRYSPFTEGGNNKERVCERMYVFKHLGVLKQLCTVRAKGSTHADSFTRTVKQGLCSLFMRRPKEKESNKVTPRYFHCF